MFAAFSGNALWAFFSRKMPNSGSVQDKLREGSLWFSILVFHRYIVFIANFIFRVALQEENSIVKEILASDWLVD